MLATLDIPRVVRVGGSLAGWLIAACWLLGQDNVQRTENLTWHLYPTGTNVSLRGLSVADAKTLWACGAGSTVIRSVDGGVTWTNCSPKYESLEFRSITGFDAHTACVASAGTPAVILRTKDAGQNWYEVYKHLAPTAFFDGLRFWDARRGIAFSDPVDGRMLVVLSDDGGQSWQAGAVAAIPAARENEGGFAASNSALCVGAAGRAWIGAGGTMAESSRIYRSLDFGQSWTASDCPIQSDASAGVFSIAANDEARLLLAVGGDYRPKMISKLTVAISEDEGHTWRPALSPPVEFVSAVCTVRVNRKSKPIFIAVGPTGSHRSDDGDHWQQISSIGFHALESTLENLVFAVGAEGRFATLKLP